MIKALFLWQTFMLALLPHLLPPFNLSFAFDSVNDKGKPKTQLSKTEDYRIKTIVIDPGHGGHDTGCIGAHSHEKHIALGISKKLGASIQASYPNIRVIYTRTTDQFVALHERAKIANRNQADLFVSIHCNYVNIASVNGSETYVLGVHREEDNLAVAKRENEAIYLEDNYEKNYDYDPDSAEGHIMLSMFQNAYLEQSISFAQKVEEQIKHYAGRKSRGVKQAGFLVLRETTMPSVLIEAGFLSNSKEEAYLRSNHGQQRMASALFRAFQNYKKEVEIGTAPSVFNTSPIAQTTTPVEKIQVAHHPATTVVTTSTPVTPPRENNVITNAHLPAIEMPNQAVNTPSYQQPAQEQFTARSGIVTPSTNTATIPINLVEFRVQLAASPQPINLNTPQWQRVGGGIEVVRESGYYKYQIHHFPTFLDAANVQHYLRTRGFKDCFVVAYHNGKKVSVEEAKRILGVN